MTNPFLTDWHTPHGLPPFDQITDADFKPAFEATLAEARAAVVAIAERADAPSFANTIEALERAEAPLSRVLGVFYSVAGADSNETREALTRDFGPQLAGFGSEVSSNTALFARVEALWEKRDDLGLTDEQMRVLKLTHRGFVRSGAKLTGKDEARHKEIMQRLSVLGTKFTQNLLAAERDWVMELDESDLEGLPDFVVTAARAAGKEKGTKGPAITTSRSLITPFLMFSPKRDLREKAYEAFAARGEGQGDADNRPIAAEILALRQERAGLLGYKSFADYKLETEMAGTPDAVREMLMAVWEPAKSAALADEAILTEMLHADGFNGALEPWDWHYYAEKRRKAEHDLDEAELKPYFQLDRMIEAAFDCANRLFGLEFSEMTAPLYHPDARAWEVTRDGKLMAVFVADYFARGSKRSGAWCGAMRSQQKLAGDIRPIVTNVCNFAKPAEGEPALLSWDDARTLFHEFGHALHHMLSDVTYESVSGTSVARDFVELPSQLYEHWLEVPEVLERFATHAVTGEVIPADMLKRLLAASTYGTGLQTVEYTSSALVDLAFHAGDAPADPMAKQADVLADLGMPHAIRMRHATPHFAHVFSGDGYSSGYYSYMWSEVMDADAFEAFQEAGSAFDPEMAKKLETHILSRGGSVEAKDLYLAFRGKMPGVDALLKGRGLS
ncbi:M3 family metallopeptidase [Aliiroseovarius lamellibrachiae]|uniref:M3 family metallopeptidase n=1 Tax=Aliiroseovarius lamellibrachiae TaxID=1924933 RepID=UPI001BE00F9C|nr:M3 family metallopeptidase [Aliiroseovarius lamellibrachiae]MBT2129714.1 M3 family metallopeptidase [Aliiroseovarius lamellibrachiae]